MFEKIKLWFEKYTESKADAVPKYLTGKESGAELNNCLLYTSPSPRDATLSRMPSSA